MFWDLRSELLEGLYKHQVNGARLQPILDCIDSQHLGVLVEIAAPVRPASHTRPGPLAELLPCTMILLRSQCVAGKWNSRTA